MVRWFNEHLTIPLPHDEFVRIKSHPEIKWGQVARKAVIQFLNEYEGKSTPINKLETHQ
jgi:hypothetical protein